MLEPVTESVAPGTSGCQLVAESDPCRRARFMAPTTLPLSLTPLRKGLSSETPKAEGSVKIRSKTTALAPPRLQKEATAA